MLQVSAACVCFLIAAVTVWVAARALTTVMTVTAAVVAALLLTALVEPVAAVLGRVLPVWLAALTTLLIAVGVVVGAAVVLVGRARGQLPDLRSAVQDAIDHLHDLVVSSPLPVDRASADALQHRIGNAVMDAVPGPATSANAAVQVLSGMVLTLFLWFFFLKDGARMWGWLVSWMPRHARTKVDRSGRSAWSVLTAYVRGTTIVAAIDAAGIGAGMFALGVPLAASLTLIVFLGAYVPIAGAFVSGALAVVVTAVTQGIVPAAVLFGVVVAVQQIEGNLLQPFIMGRALRLHPVAILVTVSVGALVANVLGAVVAVPLVAITYRIASELRADHRDAPAPAHQGTR